VVSSIAALASRTLGATPLRHRAFRWFYLGSIATAIGYTMQATVAAWLMATLTPSALMVALVQTASTAPTLLFGFVAGTLADIVDRRRVIFATHCVLLATGLALGAASLAGFIGPYSLLALTFVVGAGFTFYLPAQGASINELVERAELPRAVALGAVAFNVARAVGPALAGAIAAALASGIALLATAALFVPMMIALRQWRRREPSLPGVPETLTSGILSGLRYARHSPAMRAFTFRNFSFAICASAFWALLPVIARDQLGLGAGGFGLLSAAFGSGAVVGALAIPRHLQRRPLNTIVTYGALLWTCAMALLAFTQTALVAFVAAFGAGMAWVSVLASLSAGTQSSAPAWVRARAVALALVATQASIALGSALWGIVASATDTRIALAASAALLLCLLAAGRRVNVTMGTEADVTPGVRPPDFAITFEPLPDDGPVLIQLEYQIDVDKRDAFLRAMHAVGATRRRNGATSWRVFRDLGEEGRFVERFIISSWAEYVRLRERMTVADRALQDRVAEFQRPGTPIRVSRLLGVESKS
jgi:MFS family permease